MGFRTLEINKACEIHIKEGQLQVTSEDGLAIIPIEDLSQIMVHGANIRLSTMDLSILTQNKVSIMTLDEKYQPTAIVLPFEGHARQSKLMHAQVNASDELYLELWIQIIRQKISNQSRALGIMGMNGAEEVGKYVCKLSGENVDISEALAAKEYFSYYHKGLNRRGDDPINSRLLERPSRNGASFSSIPCCSFPFPKVFLFSPALYQEFYFLQKKNNFLNCRPR